MDKKINAHWWSWRLRWNDWSSHPIIICDLSHYLSLSKLQRKKVCNTYKYRVQLDLNHFIALMNTQKCRALFYSSYEYTNMSRQLSEESEAIWFCMLLGKPTTTQILIIHWPVVIIWVLIWTQIAHIEQFSPRNKMSTFKLSFRPINLCT